MAPVSEQTTATSIINPQWSVLRRIRIDTLNPGSLQHEIKYCRSWPAAWCGATVNSECEKETENRPSSLILATRTEIARVQCAGSGNQ